MHLLISMAVKKTCVVFDLNGTLIDDLAVSYGSVCDVFQKFGRKKPGLAEYRRLIGPDYWVVYKKHGFRPPERKCVDETFRKIFYCRRFRRSRLFGDSIPVIKGLKRRGVVMGVVSNQRRKNLREYMARYGLEKFIDVYVGRDEVKHPKPSKESLLLAFEKLGIPSGQGIYVGDQTQDIRMARSAGVLAVAVSRKGSYHTRGMLDKSKPDVMVRSLSKLLSLC